MISRNRIFFYAGISVLAILLALASFEEHRLLNESASKTALLYSDSQVISTLDEILISLQRAESNRRGYVITQENEYLINYNTAVRSLIPLLAELDTYKSIYQAAFVDSLKKDVSAKINALNYSLMLLVNGRSSDSLQKEMTNRGRELMGAIREVIIVLRAERKELLLESYSEIRNRQKTLTLLLRLSAVLEIVVLVLVVIAIRAFLSSASRTEALLLNRMNQAIQKCDVITKRYKILLEERDREGSGHTNG
ncbi:MAG: CHASE3 domain-containing protein [Ignavibacteriales bacterium]|nr:CHASE3 domain-containing protein [Ignavibacteriales bacterium]